MSEEQFKEWLKREMPEGTVIGNPEWWAKKIWQAALSAKSVPDIVMVTDMNFEGDSHYGTREGDVFVMGDGDVYTYEQLVDFECKWFYTAPQVPTDDDRVRELEKDTKRLDFLCNGDFIYWIHIQMEPHGNDLFHSSLVHNFREAIDAAMKEVSQ